MTDVDLRTRPRSGRSSMRSLEQAVRWPLYLASAAEPLVMLLVASSEPDLPTSTAVLMFLLAVTHAGVCIALLHRGIAHYLGGPPPSSHLVGSAVALTALALAVSLTVLPMPGRDAGGDFSVGALTGVTSLLIAAALVAAVSPLLSQNALALLVAGPAVGAALVQTAVEGQLSVLWGANILWSLGCVVLTYRPSVWILGIAAEMEATRDVQARLAVAEERLRFARDLHDILGRNLALIAVNSELAAELAKRGQDGAVDRMLDVRRTAEESMRDVREVVGGYRVTDLETELTGARALLRSAGVAARVIGDGAALPPHVQATLAWVVREATTNVIRHSDATVATIEVDVVSGDAGPDVVLTVENDGVRVPRPREGGNGLTGLRERLAGLGGQLTAAPDARGRFRVVARLPTGDSARLRPGAAES